jgi:hypothetical protein
VEEGARMYAEKVRCGIRSGAALQDSNRCVVGKVNFRLLFRPLDQVSISYANLAVTRTVVT